MARRQLTAFCTAQELAAQPRWTFFMAWAELVFSRQRDRHVLGATDQGPLSRRRRHDPRPDAGLRLTARPDRE